MLKHSDSTSIEFCDKVPGQNAMTCTFKATYDPTDDTLECLHGQIADVSSEDQKTYLEWLNSLVSNASTSNNFHFGNPCGK